MIIFYLGTDGHLKLADFGLSKLITTDAHSDAKKDTKNGFMGLSAEAFQKVQKFLPLKIDAAYNVDDNNAEVFTHRTIRVLLITMDDDRADSTLLFINITIEIVIADYDIDADTILASNFDAIFVDGDYYEADSVEFVANFFSMFPEGSIPVFLLADDPELRSKALTVGARACSTKDLETFNEELFDILFPSDRSKPPRNALAAILQPYSLDLLQYQQLDDAAIAAANNKNFQSIQASAHANGFVKEMSATKDTRDSAGAGAGVGVVASVAVVSQSKSKGSVTVESKSRSLVGTLYFIAPEVVKLRKYSKAVDWWACGMSFYECLTRKHLFKGEERKDVFDKIMNAPIDLQLLEPSGEAIVDLVKGLLCRVVRKRLGTLDVKSIKSHRFFEKIDWATISSSAPPHKPAQFMTRKYRAEDNELFYGPRGDLDEMSMRPENLEEKNTTSMKRYLINKKRAKMGGKEGSRSYKKTGSNNSSQSNKKKNSSHSSSRSKASTGSNYSSDRDISGNNTPIYNNAHQDVLAEGLEADEDIATAKIEQEGKERTNL